MKVVQVDSVYQYSSTGRTTAEMHAYFREHGIDSHVFCTNFSDSEKNIFRFSSKLDMKIHALLSRVFGLQAIFSYYSTKKLVKQLSKVAPDIVHLRVLHSNCINLPLLLKFLAKKNIATVITLHDCWFFTGHCCHFVDSNCDRWKSTCGKCPQIRKWNKSLFFDNSAKLLSMKKELFGNIKHLGVVGVSDWVTGFVKESILKDSQIIRRIYNWIDISKYALRDIRPIREKYGLSCDDFVVLGVAKEWSKQKGIDEFIKLAGRCPEMKFVLVGNLLHDNLPQNLIGVGSISDVDRLVDMYFMSDAFFNPSFRETFGKVTLEAIASGTPVVAYKATATPEIVVEGCGYLVEIGDIEEVAKSLEKIKLNKKSSFSQFCRQHAETNFSKEGIIRQYLNLYEQLISSK